TEGDLLIQYDLAQGGTTPNLFLSKWVTTGSSSQCEAANTVPCWGKRDPLESGTEATGSINTTTILAADSDGLGEIDPFTFGEASVDFGAITEGTTGCFTIGSAYLKSRSSDSFTAALKDFIAPAAVNISNCGQISISKTDGPDSPLADVPFRLCEDLGADQDCANDDCAPADAVATCTTGADGTCVMADVLQGSYCLFETVPAGHTADPDLPMFVTVDADANVELGFENPLLLTDIYCESEAQLDGATVSTIVCTGPDGQIGSSGDASDPATLDIDGLAPGTYSCKIVIALPAP